MAEDGSLFTLATEANWFPQGDCIASPCWRCSL